MRGLRTLMWGCAVGCAALLGCAKSEAPQENTSETHFLTRCTDACDGGLECICGVCTASCGGAAMCRDHGDGVTCEPLADTRCAPVSICDLQCETDADCAALGGQHGCAAGRCRAPALPDPPPERDAAVVGCEAGGVTHGPGEVYVADDGCNTCICGDDGVPTCTDAECDPTSPGLCPAPGCLHEGICYGHGAATVTTTAEGCTMCVCRDGTMSCGGCEFMPPCPAYCEWHGVCYPLGQTTEDGCCTCSEDGFSCIEPGWCAVAPSIGQRCSTDGDCTRGLTCRTDFAGERGVCTRPCNFGCPTGTECVDAIPDYNDGLVEEGHCLRPCAEPADCSELGSECDMPGDLERRYCF